MEVLTMNLNEVQTTIDNYFDKTQAEDLLNALTNYGMKEYDFGDIELIPDERIVGNAKIA